MKRRSWLRLARKLRKTLDPVNFGQTRAGLITVAILIAGWQLSTPARAELVRGESENHYFRLEWAYELDYGYGLLGLEPNGGWPNSLLLDDVSFVTAGTPFEEMEYQGRQVFGPPTPAGVEHGLQLYEYSLLNPFVLPAAMSACYISLRFDTTNVAVRETELNYQAYGANSAGGIVMPLLSDPLPFVTVQTIPEPSAAAALTLAAIALTATRRRDD